MSTFTFPRLASLIPVLALSLVTACAANDDGGGGGSGSGSGSGSGTNDPQGPKFLAFGTNRTTLDDPGAQTLVLSAVLTDPDGVDDLIGGSLYIEGANVSLGTFATSAQEGAYTMMLSWEQLVSPVEETTEWSKDLALTLRAEFFDQAGNVATRSTQIELLCASGDPLVWTRVTAAGCDFGPICDDPPDGVRNCSTGSDYLTGTQVCQQTFGTACIQCRAPYSGEVRSCSNTSSELSCDCQ